MVVRKRWGYGFHGHQVPNSARGKRSTGSKKNEMYAFDLLATVAGTLLADQDSSASVPNINRAEGSSAKNRASVKQEYFEENFLLKNVAVDNDHFSGCVVGSGSVSGFAQQANACLAKNSSTRNETESVLESITVKSNMLVRDPLTCHTRACELSRDLGIIPEYAASGVCNQGSASSAEAEQGQPAELQVIRCQADVHGAALYRLFNPGDMDGRPPSLISSDSSSGVPLCSHYKERKTSFCQGGMQHIADRDDGENSSGCTHRTTGNKCYKPHYLGDHGLRKLFALKVRKAARNRICGRMSNKGGKLNFCGKNAITIRQKVQRTVFERKKLARHHIRTSVAESMLTEVKLRINSFHIPELFIEVPKNATVGLLKRTVMDVVTSIREGSRRVGVLLQGNNIQDDNKTLRQAGICQGEKLNNIDFTLEQEAGQDSPPGVYIPEETNFPCADAVEPLARMKCEEPFPEIKFGDDNQQPVEAYPNCSLSGPVFAHLPVEMASQDTSGSSGAIIPVASRGSLAIAPLCKSKQSDVGQRRIRRPFSVAEVEALVEAVEQLGTGRWRDVKMCAFDKAYYRTYVDLKDKWKTLVHTASIAPQQRRGEPVPQELLDRVLSAQAYWSQQQAKLEEKPPHAEICLA